MRPLFVLFSFASLILLSQIQPATGCAIPWRLNQPVSIASEDALIVWDAATKTEHFIRRAQFNTDAKDFGFLVPTPTEPTLAEADESIFSALSQTTAARVIHEKRVVRVLRSSLFHGVDTKMATGAATPASKVQVLNQQKVGGYDAVVLKANDPEALRQWLVKHGYEARPALTEWFKWYTQNNWIITAFKISNDGSLTSQFAGRTVRLSFKTETPFYPYREPADTRENPPANGQRMLKVYFVSDKRHEGRLGKDATWPGTAAWANSLPDDTTKKVFGGLGLEPDAQKQMIEKKWHLTEFEDKSFPRPGTDEVYFRLAEKQDTLERPPIIVYDEVIEYVDPPIWERFGLLIVAAIVGLAILAAGVFAWLLLRKR
jgi:hypothetical protein